MLLVNISCSAQESKNKTGSSDPSIGTTNTCIEIIPVEYGKELGVNTLDSNALLLYVRNGCKSFLIKKYSMLQMAIANKENIESSEDKAVFIKIHGTVQYDFLYRSYVDTPFAQHNFQQHTVQTNLSVLVKDKYPINVNLSHRQSNSPFFRNFFDVNMQFDQSAFLRRSKQRLLEKLSAKLPHYPDLDSLEAQLKMDLEKYNRLKYELEGPDALQQLIKEREKIYYKEKYGRDVSIPQLPEKDLGDLFSKVRKKWSKKYSLEDSLKARIDSSSYMANVKQKNLQLDSLQRRVFELKGKTDSLKNIMSNQLYTVKQKIYTARSIKDLKKIEEEHQLQKEKETAIEKLLANTKSIGIGRSIVNYSELTISNVTLTGVNIEYNPKIYAAFAAGKIDYGFRNFFGKNTRKLGQNIVMGRFGFGDKDKRALIFSVFTGKKYNYSSLLADTATNHVNVFGYAIEGILKKNEHTTLSAEVAKTTKPITGSFGANVELKSLSDFSDHSNIGISLKGQTFLSQTDTRVGGFYRKTGKNFQSFNLFSYNTDQTAWLIKLDQPLFKNRISAAASLRRNDFVNPFTTKTFKSTTVFKSIQLIARLPKWPVISAGYYPGSQIYIIDGERAIENAYYIQNASVIYSYALGNTNIVSSVMYNKYASKGTDSGFIAYDGASYMTSHSLAIDKLQIQSSYVYTDQELLRYYTLEGNLDYSLSKTLKVGVGAKYNKVSEGDAYVGSRGFIGVDVKALGVLQLQYEKSYLPTTQSMLFPVETGRLSWLKNF